MNKKGFTLIEVLIVVSIVGLLAATVLVGLGGFRERGRDARRISDLKSLQNGLELYYTKNNFYPPIPPGLDDLLGAGIGINKIPKEPVTGLNYLYGVDSGKQSYVIGAKLDAKADDPVYRDSSVGTIYNINCGGAAQTYCVQF